MEDIKIMEYRICYNIFDNNYISGREAHNIQLYNAKKQKEYNDYIRGIIIDNTLYLRVFYPFEDIDNITKNKLYQSSYELLKDNTNDIIQTIYKHENIKITEVKYNVENDLLKGLKLVNI